MMPFSILLKYKVAAKHSRVSRLEVNGDRRCNECTVSGMMSNNLQGSSGCDFYSCIFWPCSSTTRTSKLNRGWREMLFDLFLLR